MVVCFYSNGEFAHMLIVQEIMMAENQLLHVCTCTYPYTRLHDVLGCPKADTMWNNTVVNKYISRVINVYRHINLRCV